MTSGIPTPRSDAQATRKAQSRAVKPRLLSRSVALPPGVQVRSQTPHELGLGPLASLRRLAPQDQTLEPSSTADPHPPGRPHHQEIPRLRGPERAGIRRASRGHGTGPATRSPSSRPPPPLAEGQAEEHPQLCHGLGGQCSAQASAPDVSEPTKSKPHPFPGPSSNISPEPAQTGAAPGSINPASGAGPRGGKGGACALEVGANLGWGYWSLVGASLCVTDVSRGYPRVPTAG